MENKLSELCDLISANSWPSLNVRKWHSEPGIHIGTKEAIFSSEGILIAGEFIYEAVMKIELSVDAIAGDGIGGASLAIATSMVAGYAGRRLTPLNVRMKSALVRNKMLIEGSISLPTKAKIVVVDDNIDTGRSISRVINVLRNFEYEVVAAIFLVARHNIAIDNLCNRGIQAISLLSIEDLKPLKTRPKTEEYNGK